MIEHTLAKKALDSIGGSKKYKIEVKEGYLYIENKYDEYTFKCLIFPKSIRLENFKGHYNNNDYSPLHYTLLADFISDTAYISKQWQKAYKELCDIIEGL